MLICLVALGGVAQGGGDNLPLAPPVEHDLRSGWLPHLSPVLRDAPPWMVLGANPPAAGGAEAFLVRPTPLVPMVPQVQRDNMPWVVLPPSDRAARSGSTTLARITVGKRPKLVVLGAQARVAYQVTPSSLTAHRVTTTWVAAAATGPASLFAAEERWVVPVEVAAAPDQSPAVAMVTRDPTPQTQLGLTGEWSGFAAAGLPHGAEHWTSPIVAPAGQR